MLFFCLCSQVFGEEPANIAAFDQEQMKYEFLKQKDAAAKGDTEAQYHLGFMYLQGDGIEQDTHMAFQWIHLAARSGLPEAQDTLAYLYKKGIGVEADNVRAYVWYSVAAANGVFLATRIIDSMAKDLSKTEHVQAMVMLKDYLQNYLASN